MGWDCYNTGMSDTLHSRPDPSKGRELIFIFVIVMLFYCLKKGNKGIRESCVRKSMMCPCDDELCIAGSTVE